MKANRPVSIANRPEVPAAGSETPKKQHFGLKVGQANNVLFL